MRFCEWMHARGMTYCSWRAGRTGPEGATWSC
jgi:hypothetical protein